ncbi:MAG TPA: alpha/beta fold hydrolase [Ktedonosporobacter sp.]|nr:alpha/beta fold hydrolase [Ktedonosporobacter sp.]
MTDITERIAALPPDKQAMLLQRLRQKTSQPITDQSFPQASSEGWIVRYRENVQAPLRLFCFSYAGGGASAYRSWADALPLGIEMYCIQLPGHESRFGEPPYTRMVPLIQALADVIYPYLDRPFAFFGHSMGALISFELARQLRRTHDRHPVRLCIAAFRAPQLSNPNIKIYYLPSEVFKVVMRADGIPEQILQNEELMEALLPTLRADYELCDTYTYIEESPLACPFSLFGGLEDVRVHAADIEPWGQHSSASSSLTLVPGPHLFLQTAQDLLLAEICQALEVPMRLVVSNS